MCDTAGVNFKQRSTGVDLGFFLGGGAPLGNCLVSGHKPILIVNTKKKAFA